MQLWRLTSPQICRVTQQARGPEELVVLLEPESRKKPMSQFKGCQSGGILFLRGASAFLFFSGFQLIGLGPPTLVTKICFAWSTDLNVNFTPKHRIAQSSV